MGPLKPDIPELITGLICFLLVFAVMAKVLLPRIERTLKARHDALEGGFERAEETQAETERLLEEYKREQAEARREAAAVRQQATEEGAAIMNDLRSEGNRIRDEILSAGHRRIAEDRALAEASLHAELGLVATELAGRVLGESLDDYVAGGDTIERFLAEIGAGASGSTALK